MYKDNIDYTISSIDPERYNHIDACLQAPTTDMAILTVTNLTANCNIVVLDEKDYILFDDNKKEKIIYFEDTYTDLNAETFVGILAKRIQGSILPILTEIDKAGRIVLKSSKELEIKDVSYNVRLLMGWYNVIFPIKINVPDPYDKTHPYKYVSNSVGYYLSTPVLYLVSNLGAKCYRNLNLMAYGSTWYKSVAYDRTGIKYGLDVKSSMTGNRIVMRLNNSYAANMPIIASNCEFETTLVSNDLSNIDFTLVDANMKEVNLLSPMYLSINVKGVKSTDTDADIFIPGMTIEDNIAAGDKYGVVNEQNEEEKENQSF